MKFVFCLVLRYTYIYNSFASLEKLQEIFICLFPFTPFFRVGRRNIAYGLMTHWTINFWRWAIFRSFFKKLIISWSSTTFRSPVLTWSYSWIWVHVKERALQPLKTEAIYKSRGLHNACNKGGKPLLLESF